MQITGAQVLRRPLVLRQYHQPIDVSEDLTPLTGKRIGKHVAEIGDRENESRQSSGGGAFQRFTWAADGGALTRERLLNLIVIIFCQEQTSGGRRRVISPATYPEILIGVVRPHLRRTS